MAQVAHDFSLFENTERVARKPKLRAVEGGAPQKKTGNLVQLWNQITGVVLWALFACLAVGLLQSKVTLTEVTTQIQREQNQLVAEQSTYNYLNNELNSRTSMANVEDVANRMGLMKLDDSQITYVRLEETSNITRKTSEVEKLSEMLYSGLLSLFNRLEF